MHIVLLLAAALAYGLASSTGLAQQPDAALQSLPQSQQDWVNRSCPRSLGPNLWTSCVNRQVLALRGGLPDLSKLSEADRAWVQRSCPPSLGPSLAISCLSRGLAALSAGMPRVDQLPPEKRLMVQRACPTSLGPPLFKSCAEREIRALTARSSPTRPQADSPVSQATQRATPRLRGGARADIYALEISHDDELFIINGERFEAQTYCFNMEEGDEVLFLDGSPFGACASATLLNLRTRDECRVWCE
jgi:hypothetical protein